MRSFSGTTIVESSSASNRRQPVRQTRTNPSRSANVGAPQRGLGPSQTAHEGTQNAEIGFFPAITHFTDAISALPKEMVRHYSMLKEVDAKICGPEEAIGQLVATALQTPAPPRKPHHAPQSVDTSNTEADTAQSTIGTADNISLMSLPSRVDVASTASQEDLAMFDRSRRELFYDLRRWVQEMLPILDEKNHVLGTATDCLETQLKRCNSSYRCIDDEVSEESRYGSLTHWAYTDKAAEKKGTTAGERTRRDAAIANHLAATAPAVHEAEGAALRSELRREAMAARKHRNQHLESDFDDTRAAPQSAGKRSQRTGKGLKVLDAATNGGAVGLGIANGPSTAAPPPAKRRKVDKSSAANTLSAVPMVRAMNSVYASNTGSARGIGTSPRATPGLEPSKKRGRTATVTNGTGRKRANTNTSATNSPSIASSPVVGTFSTPKDVQRRSPAPSLMQRVPSSRGRQNTTQSVPQEPRSLPPSKTSHKATASIGNPGTPAAVDKPSGPTARSSEMKSGAKEPVHVTKDHLVKEDRAGEGELRGGLAVGSRGTDKSMKKEDMDITNTKNRQDRPRSISISTRGGNKTSKTSTPTQGSFNDTQRTRPTRNADPAKRSHKKGAGLAAQLVAAQLATDDDPSIHGDGDEDEDEGDTEPRYCYCNQVSYGEMVACDMATCPREWFHLDCVGLTKAPKGNAKWFCDECKENLKKSKATNGNGR
ncbi:MAG: hypothetical protein Q9171_006035 [Xanthocarpia ochracea]